MSTWRLSRPGACRRSIRRGCGELDWCGDTLGRWGRRSSTWPVAVGHHHLPAGFVGLHHAMCFADLLEAEHPRRLCFKTTRRHLLRDFLKRHIGQRETRRAEHEAAEEGEIDTARHLEER